MIYRRRRRYFNPHSREGSDDRRSALYEQGRHISIHTPAKGVTRRRVPACHGDYNFNPHSREGSDEQQSRQDFFIKISIHTPAKGVTVASPRYSSSNNQISIHTPAKGVTRRGSRIPPVRPYFNPHSREGSDDDPDPFDVQGQQHFNPHSREGSDVGVGVQADLPSGISIHTPAKGVTSKAVSTKSVLWISIHTPAKGVTWTYLYYGSITRFQSTLPRRE